MSSTRSSPVQGSEAMVGWVVILGSSGESSLKKRRVTGRAGDEVVELEAFDEGSWLEVGKEPWLVAGRIEEDEKSRSAMTATEGLSREFSMQVSRRLMVSRNRLQ